MTINESLDSVGDSLASLRYIFDIFDLKYVNTMDFFTANTTLSTKSLNFKVPSDKQ